MLANFPVLPPDYRPVTSVQPFTYKDGATFLEVLESLRSYITKSLIPWITNELNEGSEDFKNIATDLIKQFNEIVQEIIGSSVEISDPIVAELIADIESETRTALDNLYLINIDIVEFDSVAEASAANIATTKNGITVNGYNSYGDGGSASYVRVSTEPNHYGKINTADGAWWEIAEPTFNIEMFGGFPVPAGVVDIATVNANYNITEPFNRMSITASRLDRNVRITAGHWAHNDTLNWYDGVSYEGVNGDTWRAANTISGTSWPNAKYAELSGTVFIAYGTFPRVFEVDGITQGWQNGYGRDFPETDRPYNNGLDSRFDLLDLTNKNASGSTRATLRKFSVAHYFNNVSLRKFNISSVAFIPNCPDPANTFGLNGYAYHNTLADWDSIDFGVYIPSPFSSKFNFHVLGCWNDRGVLLSGQRHGTMLQGYAENNLFSECVIQSGLAVRTPDSWPVLSKTDTSITTPWTASHRFEPTGTLRIGRLTFFTNSYTYTGITYDAVNQTITFTIPGGTDGIVIEANNNDQIWLGTGAGFANTVFRDCELFDWSSSIRVDDMNPIYGDKARPFSAALEISGYVRALRFECTVLRPLGPLVMIIGWTRDTTFSNCWMEGRTTRRANEATSESYGYGHIIIAGPTANKLADVGLKGLGDVYLDDSWNINSTINRKPIRPIDKSYYLSDMDDLVNIFWRDLGEESIVRSSSDARIYAQYTKGLDFRGRDEAGTSQWGMTTYPSGSTGLGVQPNGAAKIVLSGKTSTNATTINSNVLAGTDSTYSMGTPSKKWNNVYATNGTIQTSDERMKQDIRELSDAEVAVATELKSLIRAYKFKDAVAEKGDDARTHIGIIAQEVISVFNKRGLDAMKYGIICYDEWDEQEQIGEGENIEQNYRGSGNRFSVRYDELIAFIITAI